MRQLILTRPCQRADDGIGDREAAVSAQIVPNCFSSPSQAPVRARSVVVRAAVVSTVGSPSTRDDSAAEPVSRACSS
jgi:hypothetical protein